MNEKMRKFLANPWGQRALIIAIIFVIMAIFAPKFFLPTNFKSILISVSLYGVMACGMLVVILVGGIDLCVGSTAAMSACFCMKLLVDGGNTTGAMFRGIGAGLGMALLLGLVHGILIAYLRLPAFVVTFATQYAIYGAMLLFTDTFIYTKRTDDAFYKIANGNILGLPMTVIWFLVAVAFTTILLSCTKFGRRCYLVGGNKEAAELLGIKPRWYSMMSYLICSLTAGFTGIILASLNMQAFSSTARGYEGKVLMAMVVGGIALMGGEGGVPGAVFGAIFVGIINNALILLDVSTDYQNFVQGVVIIAAVALNVYTQRKTTGVAGGGHKKKHKQVETAKS